MGQDSRRTAPIFAWAAGAALGAAAMYLTDPDRGRRRRAIATDKMRSLASKTGDAVNLARRDLGNRMQGVRARTGQALARRREIEDDERVVARVRKELGRAVSHPHAVKVYSDQGCVSLYGPVLAHEKEYLIERVLSTKGVYALDDQLEVHAHAAGIPALQGEGKPRRRRPSIMHDSWPPALRAIAAVSGSALGIYGIARKTPASFMAAALGVGLMTRGVSQRRAGRTRRTPGAAGATGEMGQDLDLHTSIYIGASPETVFDLWSNYENFPQFMSHVKEVRDLGNGRSHWTVSGVAGAELEWDAITTESRRPDMLSWHTEMHAPVRHSGTVHFQPEDSGTRVEVHMSYRPPGDIGARTGASLFNGSPRQQMDEDLLRMKAFIEQRAPAQGTMQPAEDASRSPY